MKLTTKLFSALAMSAILTTAMSAQMQDKPKMNKEGKACDMQKNGMNQGDMQRGGSCMIMPLLQKLTLSDDQKKSIKAIMDENMKKRESMYSAFSEDAFDKNKFIKQQQEAKENRIALQAQTIEKVYALLNAKQKSQLRVLMDLKEDKMKEGCDFDKNCNGRR